MQCVCAPLKEARIKAHHKLARSVSKLLFKALSSIHQGWEMLPETEARELGVPLPEGMQTRRPDCTFINRRQRVAYLVEFARVWDPDVATIREKEEKKRGQYSALAAELQLQLTSQSGLRWEVSVIPIVVGVRATFSASEVTLQRNLRTMGIEDDKVSKSIQRSMVRNAVFQFRAILGTRFTALRAERDAAREEGRGTDRSRR